MSELSLPPTQHSPPPDRYASAQRTTAFLALIACPALALLPPRKLDFYTVGLVTATGYSANFLIRERTGRSIWQNLTPPPRREAVAHQHAGLSATDQANLHRELGNAAGQPQRMGRGEEVPLSGREAWKEEREKETREDVEEGKGLSDVIFDQVWEVWNWGKKREEEDEG